MLAKVRPFRHAASVILAADFGRSTTPVIEKGSRRGHEKIDSKLAILTVKRKTSSSFMPSTVVFPGGALDEADFSLDFGSAYKNVFMIENKLSYQKHNDEWLKYVSKIQTSSLPKPPAYEALRSFSSNSKKTIIPEWALRICALRELFEECGILIGYCLNKQKYVTLDVANNPRKDVWESGRKRVRESAREFQIFSIDELEIVPAFWLLDEWSNWLAPTVYKQRSRFDTLFYLLPLKDRPLATVYAEELEAAEWVTPKGVLENNAKGQVILAPPQVYELARLANFSNVDDLRSFSETRRNQGLIRFFPQLANTSDRRKVCILPGDDLYPKDMKEESFDIPLLQYDESADQLRSRCKNLHRAEFDFDKGQYTNPKIHISIAQFYGHIAPIDL